MTRKLFFKLLVVVLLCSIALPVSARPSRKAQRKHADKNKDGVVTKKEWKMEKKWEQKKRSKVNTALEKKYDADADGYLEPSERIQMLEDKYRLIQTNGQAKVDTAIEESYDTNSDGIIDVKEAQQLKEDLEE